MGWGSGKTGTPDAGSGIAIAMQDSQADAAEKLPVGIAASDMLANTPTAHRAAVAAADTATDLSSVGFGTGTKLTDNRGAVTAWSAFTVAAASMTGRFIFYDNAATPAPMCVGPLLTFTASARRVSAAGAYVSEVKLVETYGFARCKFFVESISSGSVDVFAEPV